jgi:hypothetical protein
MMELTIEGGSRFGDDDLDVKSRLFGLGRYVNASCRDQWYVRFCRMSMRMRKPQRDLQPIATNHNSCS